MSIKVTLADKQHVGLALKDVPEGEFYVRDSILFLKTRGSKGVCVEFPCGNAKPGNISNPALDRRLVDVELIVRERS